MQTFTLDIKRNKYIYLYYLFLHLVCLSWTNTGMVAPSSVLRLAVTFAVFAPLVKYIWMAPAVIILFVGLRFNSVAPFGYIPQSWAIYEYAILVIAALHNVIYRHHKSLFKFTRTQIGLFLFLFFVDLFNLQPFTPIFFYVLMLFVLYNAIDNEITLNLTLFSFVLLTITLSLYYFVFAQEFMVNYYGSESERATWVDPNYFGAVLGCGVVISGAYLFSAIKVKLSMEYKVVFAICIVLGFIVITLQASRGAMLAIASALVVQLLLSQAKWYTKIFFIVFSVIGIVYLFRTDYFTLLIDRTLNDDTVGSGRGAIWASKLGQWSENLVNILGTGFGSAVTKFRPYNTDCHNEFVSSIINYGIVGALIMLGAILKLLSSHKNQSFVRSCLLFICVAFVTISPITCQTGWTSCPMLIMVLYKFISLERNVNLIRE